MTARRKNGPLDFLFKKRTTYHGRIVRSRPETKPGEKRMARFKGVDVWKNSDGSFTTAIDRDSRHDTLKDAHRFIASWKKNPTKFDRCVSGVKSSLKKQKQPGNAYAICTAAGTRNPGWILIDSFKTRSTAQEVARKYPQHRIQTKRNKYELWAKNPKEKITDLIPGSEIVLETLDKTARAWHKVGKRVVKGVKRSVSNPVDLASLRYKEFSGHEPDKIIQIDANEHVHARTYALGVLIGLIVLDVNGRTFRAIQGSGVSYHGNIMEAFPNFIGKPKGYWQFNENTPAQKVTWLTGSTGTQLGDKKVVQLFIQGGDQHLDLAALGLKDKDLHDNVFVGTLYRIWYRARKTFEGPEMKDFYHDFGKVTEGSGNVCPVIAYKPLNPSIEIIGGRYEISLPDKSLGGASRGIVG